MSDTTERLSRISVALHWIIAIGMIGMIAFGLYLDDLPRSDAKVQLVALHKSIGVAVLLLAAWRLSYRIRSGMPQPLRPLSAIERKLSAIVLGSLLLSTILLPLSGIVMSIVSARPVGFFGYTVIPQLLAQKNEALAPIAHAAHAVLGKLVIGLLVLHVAAALKHHFVARDGSLTRMLGGAVKKAG
jgi:cytochrome b561